MRRITRLQLATQNMKDRYYGVNDPVADKVCVCVCACICVCLYVHLIVCVTPVAHQMLARAAERPKMTPPADVGICT